VQDVALTCGGSLVGLVNIWLLGLVQGDGFKGVIGRWRGDAVRWFQKDSSNFSVLGRLIEMA